ncbi:glucose dehydrogenase [Komagataeibacter medellinensis NBRC 3288]|uniref:Glucose dehydrogenase n=2 Tax=Komagataeibacter medellinensis TaxID=1177712 RepID=G2I635_KOMMN|nr:glucose dehydrogenase [Komagataeibacter medellinensis NBRC 3288]
MFLGGSWFYVLVGCLIPAVAVEVIKAFRLTMRISAAFLRLTTLWVLIETGFNIRELEVRLMAPSALAYGCCGHESDAPVKAG